jgi:hypothetical protein
MVSIIRLICHYLLFYKIVYAKEVCEKFLIERLKINVLVAHLELLETLDSVCIVNLQSGT